MSIATASGAAPRTGRALMLAWIALVGLWCSACLFEPEYRIGSCDLRCDQSCPEGFACQQGYCVAPGWERDCADPLSIAVEEQVVHYACQPLELEARAVGGTAEFTWLETRSSAGDLPEAFSQEAADDALKITALPNALQPNQQLTLQLQLEDAIGERAERTLDLQVRACTAADTAPPEPFCTGTSVAIALQAEGGFKHYVWELLDAAQLPPGIDLQDGVLQGEVPVDVDAAGEYAVNVRVTDAQDPTQIDDPTAVSFSATQQLVLRVEECVRLTADKPDVESVCAGDEYVAQVEVSGGEPPYAWQVSDLPPGIAFDADSGRIAGYPELSGRIRIEVVVTDGAGKEFPLELELNVATCPEIDTARLTACVGRSFEKQLEAEPDDGQLLWEKLNGPDWLQVEADGKATGEPTQAGASELSLRVQGEEGEREGVIPIVVHDAGSGACTRPQVSTSTLADACVGQFYEFQLQAEGGAGSYLWGPNPSADYPWPEWLQLDSNSGVLSGTPPMDAAGNYDLLTTLTTSSTDEPQSPDFRLRVRSVCKFGFTGRAAGRDGLYLGDVRQRTWPVPLPPRELSTDLPEELDVVSFEFSPNAERVAFVARPEQTNASDRVLVEPVVELQTALPRQVLPLAAEPLETVRQLAWSADSQKLALLLADTAPRLRLYDVSQAEVALSDDVPVTVLESSPLFWLGSAICYFATLAAPAGEMDASSSPGVACHPVNAAGELGSAAFPLLNGTAYFADPTLVQYRAKGNNLLLFVKASVTERYRAFHVFGDGEFSEAYNHVEAIADPSLRWLAQPGDFTQRSAAHPNVGIFALAPGVETYGDHLTAPSEVSDCHRIAAWERQGRALACSSDGTLRIALLGDDGSVAEQDNVAGSADFPDEAHAKAFSLDRSTFAYVTQSGQLKGVDLTATEWSAAELMSLPPTGDTLLSPVGGNAEFVVHSGSELSWVSAATAEVASLNGGYPLSDPVQCENAFEDWGPDWWCGSSELPAAYEVAQDSLGMAFVSQSGEVFSVDLGAVDFRSAEERFILVNAAVVSCGTDGCGQELKFPL